MTGPARYRTPLAVLSFVRIAASATAFVLAPFLYRSHFFILVLLRPSRLVMFFAGVLARRDPLDLVIAPALGIPLGVLGVWQSYAVGKAYKTQIARGRIPAPLKHVLPAGKIRLLQRALRDQGVKLVLLGRLATFPTYLLGSAAGSSDMDARPYLLADGAGTLIEFGVSLGLGYAIGSAGSTAKAIVIGTGVAALLVAGIILGAQFRRERGRERARRSRPRRTKPRRAA